MHAIMARQPTPSVDSLAKAFRANATGVGVAIRAARGRVLRAARAKKLRFSRDKMRALITHIQSTQEQVEAEVGEFIQSPHLLFQPIRLALTLAIPMLVPLFFMPTRLLLIYPAFVISWYLVCTLYFATEVAMRPPWYKQGLPLKDQPYYWSRFIHNPKADLGRHYEDVQFRSPVGTLLRAWFIPADDATPVENTRNMIVFVHGVGRDRRAFLRHAEHFVRRGYACLLFDFSEHGLSDSLTPGISRGTLFGAREMHDVAAAVNYLKTERSAEHVAIVGTSCGAASAILAVAEQPHLAVCVVAENPFTRADQLFRYHLQTLSSNYLSQNSHQTVRRAVFWLAGKLLMLRMGYYVNSYGPIDAVSQLACPLLVVHSTEDDIVPYDQGVAIYEAAASAHSQAPHMVKFCAFSDAAHCALFDKDPEKWTGAVLTFVDGAFERQRQTSSSSI